MRSKKITAIETKSVVFADIFNVLAKNLVRADHDVIDIFEQFQKSFFDGYSDFLTELVTRNVGLESDILEEIRRHISEDLDHAPLNWEPWESSEKEKIAVLRRDHHQLIDQLNELISANQINFQKTLYEFFRIKQKCNQWINSSYEYFSSASIARGYVRDCLNLVVPEECDYSSAFRKSFNSMVFLCSFNEFSEFIKADELQIISADKLGKSTANTKDSFQGMDDDIPF